MNKTITRSDIMDEMVKEIDITRVVASDVLEAIIEEMMIGLDKDGSLKISTFGSFSVMNKKKRVGRNPKTGVEAVIAPRRVISFKPSRRLKEAVEVYCTRKAA